jgi:hypothetical protein
VIPGGKYMSKYLRAVAVEVYISYLTVGGQRFNMNTIFGRKYLSSTATIIFSKIYQKLPV